MSYRLSCKCMVCWTFKYFISYSFLSTLNFDGTEPIHLCILLWSYLYLYPTCFTSTYSIYLFISPLSLSIFSSTALRTFYVLNLYAYFNLEHFFSCINIPFSQIGSSQAKQYLNKGNWSSYYSSFACLVFLLQSFGGKRGLALSLYYFFAVLERRVITSLLFRLIVFLEDCQLASNQLTYIWLYAQTLAVRAVQSQSRRWPIFALSFYIVDQLICMCSTLYFPKGSLILQCSYMSFIYSITSALLIKESYSQ